jgi:hypothetical protein
MEKMYDDYWTNVPRSGPIIVGKPLTEEERKKVLERMDKDIEYWGKLEKEITSNAIKENTKEAINHPSHYSEGRKYEPIDVIVDWNLDFPLGNTVKYISRAGRKIDALEDLKKAAWYLNYEIQQLEAALDKTN